MSRPAKLKVYRGTRIGIAIGLVGAAIFFIIGVEGAAMAVTSYPAMNAVTGTLEILLSLWVVAVVTNTRLIVTRAGLAYWSGLRRREVSWAEIQSFRVGMTRTRIAMSWPTVVICLEDGSTLVTNITGYTERRPGRIVDELTEWQRQFEPSAVAGGDPTQGESPSSSLSS